MQSGIQLKLEVTDVARPMRAGIIFFKKCTYA